MLGALRVRRPLGRPPSISDHANALVEKPGNDCFGLGLPLKVTAILTFSNKRSVWAYGHRARKSIRFPGMSVAAKVRTRVARTRPGSVLARDDFEGSRAAVESALSRLVRSGDLARVRNGLYFKRVKSRFGPGKPPLDDVVHKLCSGRGVGPAGWSASRALGVSTQLPAKPEYAIVGLPPTGLDDVRFRSRRNLARVELRSTEIALLEALREWPAYSVVDWDGLVERVGALVHEGEVRLDRVVKAGEKEASRNVRLNLRNLVHDLGGAEER